LTNQNDTIKSKISIRGTHIYVEDYNSSNKEALLYLHGGPGASCIDFCYQQAGMLSTYMRVIAIDQRGVLRSDPISGEEQFGIFEIIEDCEALRIKLGIKKWSILGHSFGGYIAFKYTQLYPTSIKKIIFEAPCFDTLSSMKNLFEKAIQIFKSKNDKKGIQECYNYLNRLYTAAELWSAWGIIIQLLGDNKDYIYFHGISPNTYNDIIDKLVPLKELFDKNQYHFMKLTEEGEFFKSLIPELHNLIHPSLLITGLYDPICCEEQQIAYKENVKNGTLKIFENSGHFPRMEEPDKYKNIIIDFILGKKLF
jgi:proline iminopeptidase